MICENCDKPDATIKYKDHWLCSALCVGVFDLNQANPEVFKKLHQDMGITKKEDETSAF